MSRKGRGVQMQAFSTHRLGIKMRLREALRLERGGHAVNPFGPSLLGARRALRAFVSRSPLRYRVNMVYRIPVRWQPPAVRLPSGMCWWAADQSTIVRYFKDDAAKRLALLGYLERGNLGGIVTRGREWVAYGWVGTARTGEPQHLARVPPPSGAAWVVHCRTREDFRGRGVYKFVLGHLAAAVREADPEVILYIDTPDHNRAARKGIVTAGFEPAGVARTWIVGLPKVKWWRWSRWRPLEPHKSAVRDDAYPHTSGEWEPSS